MRSKRVTTDGEGGLIVSVENVIDSCVVDDPYRGMNGLGRACRGRDVGKS
jgi:hypothetical protein